MIRLKFICIVLVVLSSGCNLKKSKSTIDIVFTQDTLAIGYTYWWSQTAPFNGNCADAHSLVFAGTIANIKAPNTNSGPLYTSQEGVIEIEQVLKLKDIGKNIYAEQKFISTDCFYQSNFKTGDMVLVFCFDYEDNYSIPGKDCILKINGLNDPLIKSIRKFIDAGDEPLVLQKDIDLWDRHDLGMNLKASIECSQEMKKLNSN